MPSDADNFVLKLTVALAKEGKIERLSLRMRKSIPTDVICGRFRHFRWQIFNRSKRLIQVLCCNGRGIRFPNHVIDQTNDADDATVFHISYAARHLFLDQHVDVVFQHFTWWLRKCQRTQNVHHHAILNEGKFVASVEYSLQTENLREISE